MRHEDLWRALDTLAAEHGLTPSGLARAAGLDATSFNRSKRRGVDGRPRWPSTESLSRALDATGASLGSFSTLVAGARTLTGATAASDRLPVAGLDDGGELAAAFDDDGGPVGGGWRRQAAPAQAGPGDYGLRVETEAFLPGFCPGDLLLVSPDAAVVPGDRVIVLLEMTVLPALLLGVGPDGVTLLPLRAAGSSRRAALGAVGWMHRVSSIGR